MGNTKLVEALQGVLPPRQIRENEPMAAHCSFRAGGPADLFLQVRTARELVGALALLREAGEPYYLLGRGTNLLVGDAGYRGAIVTMTDPFCPSVTDTAQEARERFPAVGEMYAEEYLDAILVRGETITAGAGARLSRVAAAAREAGLIGFEFAAGIPGSVGGALTMNAGAYEGEMRQVVSSAKLLLPDGEMRDFSGAELRFGYRHSILKEEVQTASAAQPLIALQATLTLRRDDKAAIGARMEELARRRQEKQPLEYGSAGSTFKRPEGHFAGRLIMEAGLSGFSIGDAAVSDKHCGFVVNRGSASAAHLRAVIAAVQERVLAHSGVRLEREVIYLD